MLFPIEHETLIPLIWTKPIASVITAVSLITVGLNLSAIWCIYNKRNLRSSSTAIIVANLACVDILVTIKDLPMFFTVSTTGTWVFEETWCATYGLTNVIFIIVSVSTLVTITTERFTRLKDMANKQNPSDASQRPIILGYVIAHTTLSYSLSLLWSKYIFVTRKSFCRVEWPPRNGFSITFLSSFIFIVPVSILIYNLLYKNVFKDEENESSKLDVELAQEESFNQFEQKAQNQLHIAVGIFLMSWTPYVTESLVSSYTQVSPITGTFTACIPLLTTSLLPVLYVRYLRLESPPKYTDLVVTVQ